MKDYFVKLFNYDKQINLQLTELIIQAGSPEKPVQLMAHLLGAQKVWLSRCVNNPSLAAPIWPDWQSDVLIDTINDNHNHWIHFLSGLAPANFEQVIGYQDSRGNNHSNKLEDMLTQVTNHGTHHRAQIGQYLKQMELQLPTTDYIFYLRSIGA